MKVKHTRHLKSESFLVGYTVKTVWEPGIIYCPYIPKLKKPKITIDLSDKFKYSKIGRELYDRICVIPNPNKT